MPPATLVPPLDTAAVAATAAAARAVVFRATTAPFDAPHSGGPKKLAVVGSLPCLGAWRLGGSVPLEHTHRDGGMGGARGAGRCAPRRQRVARHAAARWRAAEGRPGRARGAARETAPDPGPAPDSLRRPRVGVGAGRHPGRLVRGGGGRGVEGTARATPRARPRARDPRPRARPFIFQLPLRVPLRRQRPPLLPHVPPPGVGRGAPGVHRDARRRQRDRPLLL
jgi:hypothetical protein